MCMAYTYLPEPTILDALYHDQFTLIIVACLVYWDGLWQSYSGIIKHIFGFYVLTNGVFQHK